MLCKMGKTKWKINKLLRNILVTFVRFMSYRKCWNCRRTWNLCFLLIFSWKKLRPNFAFWDTFKLLRCLNSKEIKLQSSIRVICILLDLISVQLKNLKENKDSKFDDNFNTSNMTWTRHNTRKRGRWDFFLIYYSRLAWWF